MPQSGQAKTTALAERVKDRAAVPAEGRVTILDLIRQQESAISRALPGAIDAERFVRVVLTAMRTTRHLMECTRESVLGAIMVTAQLGLEPGGPLGLAHLVPYKARDRGYECQLIVGYRGYITLLERTGEIRSVVARPVYENDEFDFWYDETGDHLIHRPTRGERGKVTCFYGRIVRMNGGSNLEVMSLEDIDARRKRSQSARSDYSPWVTDFEAMGNKTCIRQMIRWFNLAPSVTQALEGDERTVRLSGTDLHVEYDEGGPTSALPSGGEPDQPGDPEPPPGDQAAGEGGEPGQAPPPPAEGDAGEGERTPTEVMADETIKAVNEAWPLEEVKKCAEAYDIPVRGSERSLRLKVGTHLAQLRTQGDETAEMIFQENQP